jgi:hypothetical protein
MIRLCDLCDLCVRILLRVKPSGLNGRPARRGVTHHPLCDLCDLCVKFLLRAKPSGLNGRPARRGVIHHPSFVIFAISELTFTSGQNPAAWME